MTMMDKEGRRRSRSGKFLRFIPRTQVLTGRHASTGFVAEKNGKER
jgi:hypothetical protein